MPQAARGYAGAPPGEDVEVSTDETEREAPQINDPAAPEPEAPAHADHDEETVVHAGDGADESTIDGADPAPPQPS